MEDYAFSVNAVGPQADWGDLPATLGYATLASANGPSHVQPAGQTVQFGWTLDAEPDGQPNPTATGDDIGQSDDEDGVLDLTDDWTGVIRFGGRISHSLSVTPPPGTVIACAVGFIDLDQDGAFTSQAGAFKETFAVVPVTVDDAVILLAAPSPFPTPDLIPDAIYSRFRLFAPSDPLYQALAASAGVTLDANGCPDRALSTAQPAGQPGGGHGNGRRGRRLFDAADVSRPR